jgi:FkbM family methyltransferase
VSRIASSTQAITLKWLDRLGRVVRAAEAATQLGVPLTRAFNRRWATAVSTVSFNLLPCPIQKNLRVVVDVGANRGDWTAAVLSLCQPEKAFAFEPNPSVFRRMHDRLGPQGVHCIQAAVGSTPGTGTLNLEVISELSSLQRLSARGRAMHRIEAAATQRVEVPIMTLDGELAALDEISLIKIDVQGYESAVIAGARRTLARTRCLVTEVLYEQDYYEGAASCLELARLIEDVSPLRLSCISAPALASDGMGAWADAVFVHSNWGGRSNES